MLRNAGFEHRTWRPVSTNAIVKPTFTIACLLLSILISHGSTPAVFAQDRLKGSKSSLPFGDLNRARYITVQFHVTKEMIHNRVTLYSLYVLKNPGPIEILLVDPEATIRMSTADEPSVAAGEQVSLRLGDLGRLRQPGDYRVIFLVEEQRRVWDVFDLIRISTTAEGVVVFHVDPSRHPAKRFDLTYRLTQTADVKINAYHLHERDDGQDKLVWEKAEGLRLPRRKYKQNWNAEDVAAGRCRIDVSAYSPEDAGRRLDLVMRVVEVGQR